MVVKSHGRKEGCDFFLKCEVQWKEVRWFILVVKSHGRKEGCYVLGVKSYGKEGRLVYKYYSLNCIGWKESFVQQLFIQH